MEGTFENLRLARAAPLRGEHSTLLDLGVCKPLTVQASLASGESVGPMSVAYRARPAGGECKHRTSVMCRARPADGDSSGAPRDGGGEGAAVPASPSCSMTSIPKSGSCPPSSTTPPLGVRHAPLGVVAGPGVAWAAALRRSPGLGTPANGDTCRGTSLASVHSGSFSGSGTRCPDMPCPSAPPPCAVCNFSRRRCGYSGP